MANFFTNFIQIHFVHRNTKYETMGEALKHGDGLAVLGVFFKVILNTIYQDDRL